MLLCLLLCLVTGTNLLTDHAGVANIAASIVDLEQTPGNAEDSTESTPELLCAAPAPISGGAQAISADNSGWKYPPQILGQRLIRAPPKRIG